MLHEKMPSVPKNTDLSKAGDETEDRVLENLAAYLVSSLKTELPATMKAKVQSVVAATEKKLLRKTFEQTLKNIF